MPQCTKKQQHSARWGHELHRRQLPTFITPGSIRPKALMASWVYYPGPGVGGHCIPIDPFYLTWKAREYDFHTRLIELAGEINKDIRNAMKNINADYLELM